MSEAVRVRGLKELQRELRQVDAAFPRELRVANLEAAEIVAGGARSKAITIGGVAAKTAPSIKAVAQQRSAGVRIGGARYPFAFGAEFGAYRYRQFKPWRGNQWLENRGEDFLDHNTGYFLYPALRDTRRQVIDTYDEAVKRLMSKAFPD